MYSLSYPTGFVNSCRVVLTLIIMGVASTSSASLGLVYVLAGGAKLCPRLPGDLHQNLRASFKEFAQVTPLKPLGIVPNADLYMEVVAATEVALGGMLIFGSRPVKRYACVGLMGMMLGAGQSLISVGRPGLAFIPMSFLGLLVLVYTNLDDQTQHKK